MLEVYSNNLTVAANTPVPLNNVTLRKGRTAVLSGVATINLNKCGVYMVSCNASITPGTGATTASLQLSKNGVLQPQAISSLIGSSTDGDSLGFVTLVQVSENNNDCCCSNPTKLQIINGANATISNINVCVTKIC